MKFGLIGIGSGVCTNPAVAKRAAQRAEELGFDSLWTGEHTVYPDPREEPSNADPDFPIQWSDKWIQSTKHQSRSRFQGYFDLSKDRRIRPLRSPVSSSFSRITEPLHTVAR